MQALYQYHNLHSLNLQFIKFNWFNNPIVRERKVKSLLNLSLFKNDFVREPPSVPFYTSSSHAGDKF
jgi:hypothetical protein